jgi:hypothetical protein
MDVYLGLKVYQSGFSQPDLRRPAQTWQPVAAISDALETAYDLSFSAAEPEQCLKPVDRLGRGVPSR